MENAKITEPMTMITDYILTIESIIFAVILLIYNSNSATIYWAVAFIAAGISAFLGGTSHGFKQYLGESKNSVIWKLTMISIGLGAVTMLSGLIFTVLSPSTGRVFCICIVWFSYLFYLFKIRNDDRFLLVILFYVPYLLIILIIELINLHNPGSKWIIIGIITTFTAFGVQVSGFKIHEHFNHNDLFHVIQMIGVYFLFLGSREFILL
ncbi:MAG: hypothetical protein INQ03_23695 [Candidatus Heimdallarchaeota archaeon]|nr:hypothetical protein [Candidatus Heimdallarchaeota archaeon]